MPPRSVKMKRRIFGFQRRVWWPKWTPASSSSRMLTTDIGPPGGWGTTTGGGKRNRAKSPAPPPPGLRRVEGRSGRILANACALEGLREVGRQGRLDVHI